MERLLPDPILKNQNWAYVWVNVLKFHTACFYGMPNWGLSEHIETKQYHFLKDCNENLQKMHFFLDNLTTITQEGSMETWQMTQSTFSALTVCNIYFYIWIHFHLNSKFIFMWSPYGLFWSVKYLNFGQKLPIWTAHHAFLESRYPKATKNPYYVSSLKGSQKTVSAHGLIPTGRAVYIRYFKINPPISVVLSFLKIISTLKDTPSHICMDSQGVYLPRIFLELFPKPVYSTAEKFQIYSVKLLCDKNLNLFIFLHAPKSKLSPRFLSLSLWQMEIAHSTWTAFSEDIFSWAEKGVRGLWRWKN